MENHHGGVTCFQLCKVYVCDFRSLELIVHVNQLIEFVHFTQNQYDLNDKRMNP